MRQDPGSTWRRRLPGAAVARCLQGDAGHLLFGGPGRETRRGEQQGKRRQSVPNECVARRDVILSSHINTSTPATSVIGVDGGECGKTTCQTTKGKADGSVSQH
eukprot:1178133-Rhodomonas_salina.1